MNRPVFLACLMGIGLAVAAPVSVAFGQATKTAQTGDVVSVELLRAHFAPAVLELALTGEVEPQETARLSFRDGGRILSVDMDIGDRVARGQELARIDPTQAREKLREAEAAQEAATADLTRAQHEYDRQSSLFQRGVTTQAALDTATEDLRTSEADVQQAEAEIEQARIAVEETVLRAPFAGQVTLRVAEPGNIAGPASPVLELASEDGLDAVFSVPDAFLTESVADRVIELYLLDQPDMRMTGTIREISPILDPQTGSVTVRTAITNPPREVGYGATVVGTVNYTAKPAFELPWTALSATAQGPAIWVVNEADMTVTLRPVTVSRYATGRIYLSAGPEEGDLIVGDGSHKLFPGLRVQPIKAE
ncbi:efflux RND transporter periplasmic adaptor subunit [Actibacterium sp. D379-3]